MSDQVARTGKNTLMLLLGTFFRIGISFGFVVFAADQLGLQRFGIYSIGIFYFELFLSLAATAVGILMTRDVAKWQRRANEITTAGMTLGMLLAIIGMFCMCGLSLLFGFSSTTMTVIVIASLALLPASLGSIYEAALVAHERSEFVALAVFVESTLRVVSSFVLIALGYGLASLFVVLLLSRSIQLIIFHFCLRNVSQFHIRFRRQEFSRFTRRWRIFAAENWMATIYTSLDVLVLSMLVGEVAVGLYSAAWKIVRLGSVAAKTYTTAVFPLLSRLQQRSRQQFEKINLDTLRLMSVVAIPAVFFICLISHRIVDLIYFSGEYVDAVPVLQVLIWVLILEFLNPFLSYTLFARGRQKRSMQVAAIALITNLIVTISLVPQFEAVGAAIGTVVSGAVATGCYMCFALRRDEFLATGFAMLRTCLAAGLVGIALYFFQDSSWLLMVAVVLLYPVLAWIFRVVGNQDLDLLRSIVRSKLTA